MILLGVVLLVPAAVFGIPVLWTLGVISIVIGALLWAAGAMGHAVGPRSHYW